MKKSFFWLLILSVLVSTALAQDTLLNKKLELTRKILTRPLATKFLSEILWEDLKIKDAPDFQLPRGKFITETQMMILLDSNPGYMDEVETYLKQVTNNDATLDTKAMAAKREKWREKFREILSDEKVRTKFRALNTPLEPYEVIHTQGYSDVATYLNHERMREGKLVPADDLKQVWINEIRKAKREIAINVFDFDLEDVADELIAAQKRGRSVKVGIDAGVIEHRPEVAKVFKKLQDGGVYVHAVKSVGLNHQKMMSIDWTLPEEARVTFSSGNLTQSCLGPEGDLVDIPANLRPKKSIPNANHVITLKSDPIASVVAHEISKTIDPGFQLKGKQYPVSGAYKFWGGPEALGAERPYITVAFTPNGALDNVNKNFISQLLQRTRGPVKMAQFAYSSETVNQALLQRAKLELAEGNKFIFKSVGDTPFAMQSWSQFLKMSGLELIRSDLPDVPPKYVDLAENEWRKLLGDEQYEAMKAQVKIAPEYYGNHNLKIDGEAVQISSKIHHKLILSGEEGKQVVIAGSFNVSKGAESNQEYVLMIKDQKINRELNAGVEHLHKNGKQSVFQEALSRNVRRNFDDAIAIGDVDKREDPVSRAPSSRVKCLSLTQTIEVLQ